jgi:hypothetical protein
VSVLNGNSVVAGEAFLLRYTTAYLGLDFESFVMTLVHAFLFTLESVLTATVRSWSRYMTASVPLTNGLIIASSHD